MADEVKRRAPNESPELRRYSSAAKSPTITHRVRGGLYEKLKASATQRELSLSEEIERRLNASFDAEALEALLRRVVRDQVLEALCLMEGFFPLIDPSQRSLRAFEGAISKTIDTMDDALAVMADAQH